MKRNDRIIFTLCLTAFILVFYVTVYDFSLKCDEIRDETLRLHILANSDSFTDQRAKLLVRDELLRKYGDIMASSSSKEDAMNKLNSIKNEIKTTAEQVLSKEGLFYDVNVNMENIFFEKRNYDDKFTLPSGAYDALRVEIGSAKGKNWWCVMYPPLCIPVALSKDEIVLQDKITSLKDEKNFKAKLLFIEFGQKLSQRLSFN